MDTILELTRGMAHNSSPSSMEVMKYSPTDSLKVSNRDNNKRIERRKPNWTESENVFLLDQFAMHREILTCKATDASTNLRKQEIWRLICANLNQNNTLVRRTPAEVRRKWKNLVTAAKKEVWEMRHQMHISGGSGTNGRKISELSQRVLQLHSSGNLNNQSNGIYGSLLSAGLLGNAGDKFTSKYADYMEDKSFIPAHFTPIITLSESNNNHIISGNHSGDGPPSPMMSDEDEEDQESSDSRNATEFLSDYGTGNEQEGMDLRVNVSARNSYASTNSRSGRSHHSGTGSGLHLRENLLSRDLGDEDEEELLEDDDDMELAMADKRYANYNGQLSNGGSISSKRDHGHASSLAIANFHHSSALANNTNLSNGPTTASAVVATALLERQHLQHLQQLATAASLRPALSTNISSHNNNNNNQSGHSEDTNLNRKCSESTEEISPGGDIFNSIRNVNHASQFMKLKNHFAAALQENDLLSNLYKERLQLQIEVLKLRKEKLSQELNNASTPPNGVIRPKVFKYGLRMLRRKNMFGHRPTLYRSKPSSSSGLKNCVDNNVASSNGPSDDITNKESEIINESVDITKPASIKKESEQECMVNGNSDIKSEEEESVD